MKLKTWLLSSYFVVMVIPLLLAYFLFVLISNYNEDRKVEEFFKTNEQLQEVNKVVDDPMLFSSGAEYEAIEELINERLMITLYGPTGLTLYASGPNQFPQVALNKEWLYKDLYSIQQGFRTYEYKRPVFDGTKLVGFYEVKVGRDEWVQGVLNRTQIIVFVFIGLFLLFYTLVVIFVNRKVNRRLSQLQTDMTAFAKGEEVMERSTNADEIGGLQSHFYSMQKQIRAADEQVKQEQQAKEFMIATISHDLKTPLTSIQAYAELLHINEEAEVEQLELYRETIIVKSSFMKQMLDDLLTFTLLQSPTYELEFVEVDSAEFFEMLLSDYDILCAEKEIDLYVSSNADGSLLVNPKQMMRVVDNLMSNALKFTNLHGRIWLAALVESEMEWLFEFVRKRYTFNFEQYLYIIVQNNGKGIEERKLEHIFEPHFQADEARNKNEEQGTGLGLSITKQIIEKHYGQIEILSEEFVGTVAICRIPKERKSIKND